MAYYAQRNYQEDLIGNMYTIAQAGSLVTAFANLLQRYGINMTPPVLDRYLADHGAIADRSWSSLSLVDKLLGVDEVGDVLPLTSPDAIVKFHHRSLTNPTVMVDGNEVPNMVDHFCAVDRISGGQIFIIDSFDGLIKNPMTYESAYGKPLAWVSYKKVLPAVVAPTKAPAGAVAAPPKVKYNLVLECPGYVTAKMAVVHGPSTIRVKPGPYYVWAEEDGMKNLTAEYGRPGSWINPRDNNLNASFRQAAPLQRDTPKFADYQVVRVLDGFASYGDAMSRTNVVKRLSPGTYYVMREDHGMLAVTVQPGTVGCWINPDDNVPNKTVQAEPAPVPAHAATETNTVTEVEQSTAPNWRASYQAFPKQPTNFYATKTFIVHDLEGRRPDTTCHKFDLCPLAGTFVGPDGVLYGRTVNSTFPSHRKTPASRELPPFYYGLDMRNLMHEEEVWSTQTDIVTRAATHNLKPRDHLAIALGRLAGWFERLGKQKDITKG